jgi:hypothetical protein
VVGLHAVDPAQRLRQGQGHTPPAATVKKFKKWLDHLGLAGRAGPTGRWLDGSQHRLEPLSFPVSSAASRRSTRAASRSCASMPIIGPPAAGPPFSGALRVADCHRPPAPIDVAGTLPAARRRRSHGGSRVPLLASAASQCGTPGILSPTLGAAFYPGQS